jgi:4-hydroxybenzoate polyprenyltransferase
MKNVAYVFISIGLGIMFLGGMMDADGVYYILLIIAIAGLAIMYVESKREEKRKAYFYDRRRRDKLDADVEFLGEFEDKKIAP